MTPIRRLLRPRHLVAGLGLATVVLVVATVPRPGDEPEGPGRGMTAMPAPGPSPSPATPPAPVEVPPTGAGEATPVRTITGPGIAPLPHAEAPPVRVAPPAKPVPPPSPIEPRRLAPVVMEDTATLSAGRIRVSLPGVAIIAESEVCRDRAGVDWPCGRRALAGVRALVRGRVVECPLPKDARSGAFAVDCRVAGADLAERIVASGWARALDGESALGEAERQARARGLGLFAATAPVAVDPFPDPGKVPADHITAPIGATDRPTAPPATGGDAAARP